MKIKNAIKYLCKITALSAVLGVCLFQAPYVHKKYIRNIAEESAVQIVGKEGMGSGAQIRLPNGKLVIVTNKHICDMTGPLMVKAKGMVLPVARKVIKISKEHDLCAIEALTDHEGIDIGSAPTLGDELYTLGYPRGDNLTVAKGEYMDDVEISLGEEPTKEGKCLEGEIQRIESWFGFVDICVIQRNTNQLSTPTYPGNSGSTVVNKYGNLVGVIFAGNPAVENNGFMVPLSYVKEFLNSL